MNLIEQQNAAKDLPMQYLQQAVNGQNPNLTPWIATAELQRRTTMNQHMAPQGPQGPQPTVKDQVEQKAGLMATQAAQQAQAAQAQQSSTPPGPIPGGIPQPQPQPDEPVMAARGGLMNAPVNFQFAHGGILGFDGTERSSVPDPEAAQLASDRKAVEEGLKKFGYAAADIAAMPFRAASALLNTLIVRPTRAVTGAEVPYFPMMGGGDNSSVTPYSDRAYKETQADAAPAAARARADDRVPRPSLQGQGIKAALPQPAPTQRPPMGGPQRPPAPGPVTPQAPTTQPPAMDPAEQAAQTYSTTPVKQMSAQDAIGEEQTMAKAYNLDQPMGVEERAIIAQRNAARDVARKREGDDAFSAYVSGLIGVPGEGGRQYSLARQGQDAAEREHLTGNLKDIKELNTAQRAAQEKRATVAGSSLAAGKLASAEEGKNKAQVATTLTGDRMRALTSKYNTDEQVKSARETELIRQRAENARHGSTEHRLALQELADREKSYDNDIKYLEAERKPLMNVLGTPVTPAAKLDLERIDGLINAARTAKAAVRGGKQPAPAGTMAPDRAKQFKVLRPS